jgi:uncharacterized protein (TIGR00290 family)
LKRKVLLAWSGGKDSALALWRLQQDPGLTVVGLLTTFTQRYDRVQMHGQRRVMIEAQAEALGLPLHTQWVPPQAPNRVYEETLRERLGPLRREGVSAVAFGDLFLADIRAYRERLLEPTGLEPLFPLWGEDTAALAREVLEVGIHATVVCVNPQHLDASFLGRAYDASFLSDLPAGVDPCGENGEFHTFVHNGPHFANPLTTLVGVRREWLGHLFTDLLPLARPLAARRRAGA